MNNLAANLLRPSLRLVGWLPKQSIRFQAWTSHSKPPSIETKPQGIIRKPPVVTIMGHVDHGKTTLLDNLRNSQIVKQEFGGITQHIGAFVVPFKSRDRVDLVTFLDTPGHAAFSAMRQRGANVTDIVVLVVACDDGVLDQTVESVNYAKSSDVPIIVAVNKIDRVTDEKDLEKSIGLIRKQLIVHDIITELDGGDVQLVEMSALKGMGVDLLKEAILAQAETMDLKAELDCPMSGHIVESQLDPHRGKLSTILVEKGQIRKGDIIVSGNNNWAKVRALFDERGKLNQSCGPGLPIQVTGWREEKPPSAGDPVIQVINEVEAKSIIHQSRTRTMNEKAQDDGAAAAKRAEDSQKFYKQKLKEKQELGIKRRRPTLYVPRHLRSAENQLEDNDYKINIVLKCDVDGSLDALLTIFDTYDRDHVQPVKLDLMHYGVGAISEGDYNLAKLFKNSVIYGFNVIPHSHDMLLRAKKDGLEIKTFNVIYRLIDDLRARIQATMPEIEYDSEVGRAIVMQEYVINQGNKKKETRVAGCRCTRGIINSDSMFKLERNREVLADNMKVMTLKQFKDDVKEVVKDNEFGITFHSDKGLEFKPNDELIGYEKKSQKQILEWNLKGFS